MNLGRDHRERGSEADWEVMESLWREERGLRGWEDTEGAGRWGEEWRKRRLNKNKLCLKILQGNLLLHLFLLHQHTK